jgi:hypothetical protein
MVGLCRLTRQWHVEHRCLLDLSVLFRRGGLLSHRGLLSHGLLFYRVGVDSPEPL